MNSRALQIQSEKPPGNLLYLCWGAKVREVFHEFEICLKFSLVVYLLNGGHC
jgi:hypothetical protein